jgi:epoxyqueuosine reductase QueG
MNNKIASAIQNFVKEYKYRNKTTFGWRQPIIGFAQAQNPMFERLRLVANPNHALPTDLLSNAKTVIAFFLPFEEEVVHSNTHHSKSSAAWDIAYNETNQLIEDLSKYLQDILNNIGFQSFIIPPTDNYDKQTLLSKWSHRHVAYIAGLGTFGIHNMLITSSGCCGRLGSLITDLELKPTKRKDIEYCLFKYNKSCKKCVNKCVNNAFIYKNNTFICNKFKCNEIFTKIYPNSLGCGKCMCGVPCSMTNPVQMLLNN